MSYRGVENTGVHLGVGGKEECHTEEWDNTGVHLGVGGKEECHTEGWTTLVFI